MQNKTFPMTFGWQTLLTDPGLQPGHVLRRAGLPNDLPCRGAPGFSSEDYFRFRRALEVETGDALFSLRLVDTLSAESFAPPLFATLCSATTRAKGKAFAPWSMPPAKTWRATLWKNHLVRRGACLPARLRISQFLLPRISGLDRADTRQRPTCHAPELRSRKRAHP